MPVLLGDSAEATFAVDDRGIIVAWNAAAERLLGYGARTAVGSRCHDLMHGYKLSGAPMCGENCPVVNACKRGTAVRRFDMIVPRPDGIDVHVEVVTATVYEDGEPVSIHVVSEVPSMRTGLPVPSGNGSTHAAPHVLETLTARESAVLGLLAEGVRTQEIAHRLRISRATVRNHVQNVITKLGVHSRVEAVVTAIARGLVQTP